MKVVLRAGASAALFTLALAGCSLNAAPPVAAVPSSVVVQQPAPAPSGGTVVVQPRY